MRIAVVQTQPAACEIDRNIQAHDKWVKKVAAHGAGMVFFPELSLLGYEPKHAARFAMRAVVAPAICYESLLEAHCDAAAALGSTVYVASVAKSAKGIAKADAHYPSIARRHSLHVLMANCVGPCDDFEAVGGSGVWNARGELLARLPASGEGALLLDTAANETTTISG